MSSPSDKTCTVPVEEKPGIIRRVRLLIAQFKHDLRAPLPGLADKPLPVRIAGRFRYLFRRYGLKLVVVIVLYYLIRDTILYIIIPYLIARQFIG